MHYKILGSTGYAVNCPKVISLDTEYSQKQVRGATLLSISIGVSPELTYILDDFTQVQRFINSAETVYVWNGVVDWYILTQNGYQFPKEKMFDCMLAEHLVDERLPHGLGDFALREYNDDYKNEFWSAYKTYQEAPKEAAYEYELRDGCYTYRAGVKYQGLLKGKLGLLQHVHKLQWALFDTEIKGIAVDLPLMVKTKAEMSAKINEYLPKLRREFNDYCNLWEIKKWKQEINKRKSAKGKQGVARPVFSFTSDKQVADLLFGQEYLGLRSTEKTKGGSPSTAFDSLKELSKSHPEISTLVEYKEVKGIYATFVDGMLERVENGRIYPGFFVNGTATGRISHNNPNMGNLPKDGVIRYFFVPDRHHSIVGADYSQLEVVVEANLTEDPQLLKIILEGASKHDITATGLGLSRDQAKTLNFALQYGAGIHKICQLLSVSYKDGQEIFEAYWKLYGGIKNLKDKTFKTLHDEGQVTNIFGRTRHFDKPKNEFEKAKQERQAYSHMVQGPGADMMNMASYTIAERFNKEKLGRFLFSVHDEAVTEVQDSLIDQARCAIVDSMEVPNAYLNLKYPVQCKLYGPLKCWSKE
ncbi:MAG: hypothetical protein NVS1B10_03130 [Candidatus Saccharimonadales bacterium]